MSAEARISAPADVVVVGAGLIGTAAARHLAEAGLTVLLLGPVLGNDLQVHASHLDEARITRFVGPDDVWAALARKSIARYSDIERRSGVPFHDPCGHLRIDLPLGHPLSVHADVRRVAAARPEPATELDAAAIAARFPALNVGERAVGHWDPAPAGLIHPLRLITAQRTLLQLAGGEFMPTVVRSITKEGGHFSVRDHTGRSHRARRVLVAAGAYSSRYPLTPEPLELDVRPETVLLVETPEALRRQLGPLPGMIWNFDPMGDPRSAPIQSVYILPPVPYPDGRWYLKIGADHDRDQDVSTLEAMHTYMSGPGSRVTGDALKDVVFGLIPMLRGTRTRTKPCLLTYSPHGYPMIDEVEPGWFVATAGCGKSAKSSDQSGKLAADLVLGRPWEGFAREDFRAVTR